MTDKYKGLRDALAAGPTPGPWQLEKFHPIITDSAPGSSRVWICKVAINTRNDEGRKNEAYIAAAHPETIRALLAERDDLLENGKQAIRWAPSSAHWSNELKRLFGDDARLGIDALESQLRNAQAERDALREALIAAIECGMVPKSSVADGGASAHARQVVVADMIRAALAQHQGEKHGDQ